MSNEDLKQTISDYISKTTFATLATVRSDKAPVLRAIGSFAQDGLDVYFSTGKNTVKVKEIEKNNLVSFFFQHEGQDLKAFKNVALIGKAEKVKDENELKKAVELLSNRSPHFKARVEKGELGQIAIFKVTAKEAKYLDFSKGFGADAVQEIII